MKSMLLHLDASPRAEVRLAIAQGLARRHGAELNVLYGVVPTLLSTPWVSGEGMAAAASALAELDRDQRDRARALFDKALAQGSMTWIDGGTAPYHALLARALYADLLVLGQPDANDLKTGALPIDLVPGCIIDSGKPALLVPWAGRFQAAAATVLMAWKPTREAACALAASLPWLRDASLIHVAHRPEADDNSFDHGAAMQHWLKAQGVLAPLRMHTLGPGEVGEALLSLAADVSAELLVMGCYGHSRAREWVLGGASRKVLASMTLPVLMAH